MTMQVKGKVYIVGLTALILFGIFTLNLYAYDPSCETRTIKVTIEDANGPVNDAKVTITIKEDGRVVEEKSEDLSNKEYKKNEYTAIVKNKKTNNHTIKISHPDYQTYQFDFELPDGCGIFAETVRMKK